MVAAASISSTIAVLPSKEEIISLYLESNSITDITDVELYFHIFDTESWDTIQDTEVIAMSF